MRREKEPREVHAITADGLRLDESGEPIPVDEWKLGKACGLTPEECESCQ